MGAGQRKDTEIYKFKTKQTASNSIASSRVPYLSSRTKLGRRTTKGHGTDRKLAVDFTAGEIRAPAASFTRPSLSFRRRPPPLARSIWPSGPARTGWGLRAQAKRLFQPGPGRGRGAELKFAQWRGLWAVGWGACGRGEPVGSDRLRDSDRLGDSDKLGDSDRLGD